MGKERIWIRMSEYCEICKLHHAAHDVKFKIAQKKFGKGYVMSYKEQREIKKLGYELTNNEELSLPIRIAGAEMVLRGWFSESVNVHCARNGQRPHPTFREYVAMCLKKAHTKCPEGRLFPKEINDALIEDFGLMEGLEKSGGDFPRIHEG